MTVDAHSEEAFGVLGLPLTSLSPAGLLAAALPSAWTGADVTFVAPDAGAIDRCRALADAAASPRPVAWLSKHRSAVGIVHTDLRGEVDRRALIVDDILDTGATLLACCRLLARYGVEEVAVVITHAVLSGTEWMQLSSAGVKGLWLTDTIPGERGHAAGAELVPVAPLLASLVREPAVLVPNGHSRVVRNHGHET